MKLHVDMGERLQTGAKAARRAAHTLGNTAHTAAVAGQERDDAIGFP